jgi:hypothetical protein
MQTTVSNVLELGLALPPTEREILALSLWQSLLPPEDKSEELDEILAEVYRRDAEMTSGMVEGIERGDAIAAARQALRCE